MLRSVTAPEFNTKFSMCVCFVCVCAHVRTHQKRIGLLKLQLQAAVSGPTCTLGMELKSSGKVVLSPAPWV